MRTAIFVYESSSINIQTTELGAELSGLGTSPVLLAQGANARSLARGVYKILSSNPVDITGDLTAVDTVVTTQSKENNPIPPSRAATLLAPIDPPALTAFFAVPDARELASP